MSDGHVLPTAQTCGHGAMRLLVGVLTGVACALAGLALVLVVPLLGSTAEARAVGRGIVDNRLETRAEVDLSQIPALAKEIGADRLRARWTRIVVYWWRIQPYAPGVSYPEDADGDGYTDSYVRELSKTVGELRANHVKVILTPTEVPAWASDQDLWSPGYSPSLAMDVGDPEVLAEFGKLGAFLASSFNGAARYFECWNEPNTGGTFYPQSRPGDRYFGLRVYMKMLHAFYDGVKSANSRAVVMAGATSPRGADDEYSTSPRTFAKYLHDHRAGRYFDAYSHHPYCWGAPNQMPPDSRRTVWLANLGTLLKLFPKKDFYLTEFGYGTESPAFIGLPVTETTQALYLRQACKLVGHRYPQVKALLWFMVQDLGPEVDRPGAYMGLSRLDGTRKPGWFAFAGGNTLSLKAPRAVRKSATFVVSGLLTNRALGALAGKKIVLQRRRLTRTRWQTMARAPTGADGSYRFRVTQAGGKWLYRVSWRGVCESAGATVRTNAALRQLHVRVALPSHAVEPYANVTPRVKAIDQRGRAIKGVRCVFTWHEQAASPTARTYTNAAGVARHTRNVGSGPSGFRVSVTVRCAWRGQVRTCRTWFVPGPSLPAVPKVVFIGDSIAAGYFATTEASSFRGLVRARFVCSSELIGLYGWRSEDVDPASITAAAGDIVVVEMGTNDVTGNPGGVPGPPADLEANLRTVAEAARAGNAACRLIFLSVWGVAPARRPYDARIAVVAADYGRHFVSIAAIKDNFANSMPKGVATYVGVSDGWHPNNAGHAAIATAVGDVIAKLLGQDVTQADVYSPAVT